MKLLKALLAARVNQLVNPLGVAIVRYPTPAARRRRVLMKLHNISTVVDIGANVGQYGHSLRKQGYTGRIESYEPLPQEYRALKKRSKSDGLWTTHNLAVDSISGNITMHIAANSESSSILPMLQRHVDAAEDSRTVGNVTARAVTLKEVLSELRGETVMLKIDTQGNEQRVLDGGHDVVGDVKLIEIELSLVALYEGQSLFRDIDSYLMLRGFNLVSLEENFFDETTGELLQVDAIYANNAGKDSK